MKKYKINLQMFGEGGGAGAGASAGTGNGGAEGSAETGVADQNGSEDLSNVVYGKASGEPADPKGKNTNSKESLEAQFQEMIKGDYRDIYAKRTQAIIDDRFKKYKGIEERMNSINPILSTLADKYGVKADDIGALTKAIEDDDTFYQQAAMDAGLTVKQYKEVRKLEKQNEELLAEKQRAQKQEEVDRIYANWMDESKTFAEKYGIKGFDFRNEIANPDFKRLLAAGISVEGAYKATHFDDMVGGAMAHTAATVKADLVNSINQRASRPSEGATMTRSATTFKTDVNSLTKADREEIERRALRGERIIF